MSSEHRMLIDGRMVAGDAELPVMDPATGTIWTHVSRASSTQAEAAIAAARRAQPGWTALPWTDRQLAIGRLAGRIEARSADFARTITTEQGKPLAEALLEVGHAVAFLRAFAAMELEPIVVQDDAELSVRVHYKALGVVAGITPWNFPLLIPAYKLAPAVLLGNAFILKPAPTTPATALLLGEVASDIFPPGVLSVLPDENDLGPFLSAHPDIRKITFTGSTQTGRRVMAAAAETLKRITLELGGNDAAIVLDDADIDRIAPKLFGAATFNAGQVCIAIKRIYAHRAVHDRLCDALVACAEAAVPGRGLDDGVTIGPMHNQAQYEKARHYLAIAKRDGRVLAGGLSTACNNAVRPAIVRDIAAASALVQEEQFAPILPILSFDEPDDALRDIAGGLYGLAGSVWSGDEARAMAIAERIGSGTVWINHHLHFAPHIPFPGAGASGIGVEFAREGLAEYGQMSVISVAR